MLLDPRNGREWDLPPSDGPVRSYVIASTPRCGSTLLCRSLWDSGGLGAPKEYLNPMQLRDWELRLGSPASRLRHWPLRGPLLALVGQGPWPRARLAQHLARVQRRRTDPSGWFGLKLHHHHLLRWFGDEHPSALLGPIRWIWLRRQDTVAQAVSWVRARQTGQWASHQRALLPARYSRRAIQRRLDAIEAAEADWAARFGRWGVQPLQLSYRDLVQRRAATLAAVYAWLDTPTPRRWPAPELKRQADARAKRWVARFRG